MVKAKAKEKRSKSILINQSSMIGWIVIIVDAVDTYNLIMMSERRMIGPKRMRSSFSIVRKMDIFVETIPVKRTK